MNANRLYIGDYYSVYSGYLPDIPPHQHTTGAICVALGQKMAIKSTNTSDYIHVKSVFIPQDHSTSLKFYNQPVVIFCFEVESPFYKQLRTRFNYSLDRITPNTIGESRLIEAILQLNKADTYNRFNTLSLCQALVPDFPEQIETQQLDARILRVVQEIKNSLDINHEVEDLALIADLSTGRLTHLFREQTGLPIRRFRVWVRMRCVLKLFSQGHSMTDAAIASGFSDSSHFSNSCKKLLGLKPSDLLASKTKLELFVD